MKRVKKHFVGRILFDDATIRLLFRVEYETYEKFRLLSRIAVAAVLILIALLSELPTYATVLCLMIGAWLIAARDFPSKIRAERVLEQRGNVASEVVSDFTDAGIFVAGGASYRFRDIDRLVEDNRYLYIFFDRQTAVAVDKSRIEPCDTEGLKAFISNQSGKAWRKKRSLLLMNRRDLAQMVRDRVRLWSAYTG